MEMNEMLWQRQAQLQQRWLRLWQAGEPSAHPRALAGWWCGLREWLVVPFDLARHQHAASVRAGLLPCSLLESQRFERQLGLLERLALGQLARQA
jgi:hypothetical protein